jgi:nucleoid DNA-binding protein
MKETLAKGREDQDLGFGNFMVKKRNPSGRLPRRN